MNHPPPQRGMVAWMADNPVAANLLMFTMILAGVIGLLDIRQEVTPDFSTEGISIRMQYPGASPSEVEDGIVLAIENALTGMAGIEQLLSSATEGTAQVTAELQKDADPARLVEDIRNAISRITSFPEDAEPPVVERRQHTFYVISLGVAATLDPVSLFDVSERIRREILDMPGVAKVEVRGRLAPQINLEVSRAQLRALDLRLADIAAAVRNAARDTPAGAIETRNGEILLRTEGRRERALEYRDIPLKTLPDGSRILLGDVASVVDGFEASSQVFEFNGKPGMRLDVYQTQNQHPVRLAGEVRSLVDRLNHELPDTVEISINNDRSRRYAERTEVLLKNGAMGLTLVVIALGVFLNLRLAFWVAVSIPVVFTASFAVLPAIDVTLNMISMFAFILTLGIVVDDAIIVGENIFAKTQQGLPIGEAVTRGVREMVVPVLYAVGTNIIAFIPLLMVSGPTGQFMLSLPLVACVVFSVSLVEALLVLPAHLNHGKSRLFRAYRPLARAGRFHDRVAGSLDRLRDGPYRRLVGLAVRNRYITLVLFSGFLAVVAAWYESGRIDLSWRPEIPGNRVDAELEMPVDASIRETLAVVRKVEDAGLRAIERLGGREYLESWFTRAGWRSPSEGDVNMYLVPDDQRPFTQEAFTRVWREEIGDLPEVKSLFFEYLVGPGGNKGLRINLTHDNRDVLEDAARELAAQLETLNGVVDVSDGIAEGKQQIAFTLTPEGRAVGLSETALGRQVRNAFHGAEAQRILRGGNEIKVIVRLPGEQRVALDDLNSFLVRAPDGTEIPLHRAAAFTMGRAYSAINREDGRRVIRVSGSFDKKSANTRRIRATLESRILPAITAQHPGLEWHFSGGRRDRNKAFKEIFTGLAWVSLAIYALTAALFRSYAQGVVVMLTIPYSVAAAIAGHVLMGFDLSSVSIYGMIALCGLVVNGALVLTLRLNEQPDPASLQAKVEAAVSRFRPIVLTSLTTTAGLFPMLFEDSTQARFLVPMAIALSFGTIGSAFVVLFLIPALHAIRDDLARLLGLHPHTESGAQQR